jgi:hypothetical protein
MRHMPFFDILNSFHDLSKDAAALFLVHATLASHVL